MQMHQEGTPAHKRENTRRASTQDREAIPLKGKPTREEKQHTHTRFHVEENQPRVDALSPTRTETGRENFALHTKGTPLHPT